MAINGIGPASSGRATGMQPAGKAPAPSGEGASEPSAPGGPAEESSGEEYPQGVSHMLKEVHGLLQKTGKGLPGFQVSQGIDRKA